VTRLADIAAVVRSKNTSPFTYSLDILLHDERDYRQFKSRQLVNPSLIAGLYRLPAEQVLDVIYFDPARAIKVCLPRQVPSGSPGDRDVYGAQQHAPLLLWEFELDAR
jgi:hypothetical protein